MKKSFFRSIFLSIFCTVIFSAGIHPSRCAKSLPLFFVKQIIVLQQNGKTCGIHALANALTLHNIFQFNQELPSKKELRGIDNTKAYNHICNTYQKEVADTEKELSPQELKRIAVNLTYEGLVIPMIHTNHNINPVSNHDDYHIERLHTTFNCNEPKDLHFLFTYYPKSKNNSHTVTISLIKQENKEPFMIYMDSNNIPLSPDSKAIECMHFIHDNLLPRK